MVGASNVFNQIIEIELDAKMDRTKNRPLPSGSISKQKAFILGCVLTILGLIILYNVNPKTAMFGAISIFMYVSLRPISQRKTQKWKQIHNLKLKNRFTKTL